MKFFLLTLVVFVFFSFAKDEKTNLNAKTNPFARWNKAWNDPRYLAANTAQNSTFLNSKEKEFIFIINLARMNPVLFGETVVKQFPDSSNNPFLPNVAEYKSLLVFLGAQQPMPLLYPDSLCWISAKCHAITSGKKGYVGHERQSPECKKSIHYMGECCHYGETEALDVFMSLIIDQDVPSLGHRKICFSSSYNAVGVSFQPHTKYNNNVVVDFY